MHSEQHGAATVIIKNPAGGEVPHLSIHEAATFELCHSPAWDNNVLAQVYWVHASQVSKTPPTGMFIGTGSFIIRGKRNFVAPKSLILGQTLMFCLNEESLGNHMGDRKPREELTDLHKLSEMEDEEQANPEEKTAEEGKDLKS